MHISPLTTLPVIALALFRPALGAIAAIKIPQTSHASAVEVSESNARIYYQDFDTSIHELSAFGSAGSGGGLVDRELIRPDVARKDTPIASLSIGSNFTEIHVFYISNAYGGSLLSEFVYDGASNGWKDGPLNSMKYIALVDSHLMYTLSVATTPKDTYGVGFLCSNGQLCEATHNATHGWTMSPY